MRISKWTNTKSRTKFKERVLCISRRRWSCTTCSRNWVSSRSTAIQKRNIKWFKSSNRHRPLIKIPTQALENLLYTSCSRLAIPNANRPLENTKASKIKKSSVQFLCSRQIQKLAKLLFQSLARSHFLIINSKFSRPFSKWNKNSWLALRFAHKNWPNLDLKFDNYAKTNCQPYSTCNHRKWSRRYKPNRD